MKTSKDFMGLGQPKVRKFLSFLTPCLGTLLTTLIEGTELFTVKCTITTVG